MLALWSDVGEDGVSVIGRGIAELLTGCTVGSDNVSGVAGSGKGVVTEISVVLLTVGVTKGIIGVGVVKGVVTVCGTIVGVEKSSVMTSTDNGNGGEVC